MPGSIDEATVLLVDDNDILLRTLVRALRCMGIEADGVTTGAAALRRLTARPYRAVISDYMIGPGIDGLEVLTAAARFYPDSIRILLTGSADDRITAACEQGSVVTRVLQKPVELDHLRQAIGGATKEPPNPEQPQASQP